MDAANHLTSVGGVAVTTDANGNILTDNTGKTYPWDARGRLTQVNQNGTPVASYTYATNNTRSSMTENGVTTSFTLDGSMCVNEAVGSSNTPTLFGPTGPISCGTQWFSPDASGSIAAVTDGNTGLQIAQNCYGLFGQVATTNPNSGDPLQYLGGMNDTSVGLNYLGGGGAWSASLGQGIGGNLAAVASLAPGSFASKAGQYYLGLIDCGLQQARPILDMLDPTLLAEDTLQQASGVVNSVRQVGVVGTLQAALNGLVHTYTDWLHPSANPRAAGRSLCNTAITVVTFVGGAAGGGGGPSWQDMINGISGPGAYDATVASEEEGIQLIEQAKPDAVRVPDATDPTGDYPKPDPGVLNWWQVQPAGEPYDPRPHIKYEDWTGGKKGSGGSWGHIYWPG